MPPISGKSVPTSVISYDEAFAERLSSVIKRIGGLVKAAELAGVTDEQIGRWRDGKAKPNFFSLASLAIASGFSLDWLASGDDLKEVSASGGLDSNAKQPSDDFMLPDMIMVPRFDVQASAGHGAVAQIENVIDSIAFKPNWLRERGINPVYASILEAKGDSMEPTIRDGDMLIVDRSITTAIGNGIYIVIFGGNVLVKRVNMRRDGSLVLISDNDRYGQEEVPADEVPDIHIAARVMWYGRSI